MWALILILTGASLTLFLIAFGVDTQKKAIPRDALTLKLGTTIFALSYLFIYLGDHFSPGLLRPSQLFIIPWVSVAVGMAPILLLLVILSVLTRQPLKWNHVLMDWLVIWMTLGTLVFLAFVARYPHVVLQAFSGISPKLRILIGAVVALEIGGGLFLLRLNYSLFYALLEIGVGILAACVVVRGFVPDSPVLLERTIAFAGALYVIVRGIDDYRKAKPHTAS